jgi:hypothetical protein
VTEDRRRFEVRLVSHIMAGLRIAALSGRDVAILCTRIGQPRPPPVEVYISHCFQLVSGCFGSKYGMQIARLLMTERPAHTELCTHS